MASTATAAPICFGNVVKLLNHEKTPMGFLERKNGKNGKNSELLLVMGPAKESAKENAKDEFQEAEFIVAPIRCEKPPTEGTPLKYKQPFVLMTSSAFNETYSLNNKMHSDDTIGLQCRDVKGEMYVTFEKEGYTMEANVMDGDSNLDLVVVDSNRMRKNYNKKLAVQTKNKSLTAGGYITCSSKGKPLSLRIELVPNAKETKNFAKTPIERRRSTLTKEMMKEDELARPKRVNSDVTEPGAHTPSGTSSSVALNPMTKQEAVSMGDSAPVPAGTTPSQSDGASPTAAAPVEQPASTTASNTESTAATDTSAAMTAATTTAATKTEDAAANAPLEEKSETAADNHGHVEPANQEKTKKEATPKEANDEAVDAKAGAGATPSSTPGATPQAAGLSIPQSPKKLGEQQQSSLTLTSEVEGEEKLDSNCLGENKCLIM